MDRNQTVAYRPWFLETWTGIHEPNISAWRRAICGDLTNTLNFASANTTFPSLPATGPLVTAANNEQKLPAPELHRGRRPVRPAPGAVRGQREPVDVVR